MVISTHPSKGGVRIAPVRVADVPAVVRLGGSGKVQGRDSVVEGSLNVELVVLVESYELGLIVAGVEQRDADIGGRVVLERQGRRNQKLGGLQVPGDDARVADAAVGGLGKGGGVESEDRGVGQVLAAEAETFNGCAFVASVECGVVERLVVGLQDEVEGLGADVVELCGGGGREGANGGENSGLHCDESVDEVFVLFNAVAKWKFRVKQEGSVAGL